MIISSHSSLSAQIFFEGAQVLFGAQLLERITARISPSSSLPDNVQGFLMALEDVYGICGGRGLAFRIGQAAFPYVVKHVTSEAGFEDKEFHLLPPGRRLGSGLRILAQEIGREWEQAIVVSETPGYWVWRVQDCPACLGRRSDAPCCYVLAGMLQAYMTWAGGGRYYQVKEVQCQALGDSVCIFEIANKPLDLG